MQLAIMTVFNLGIYVFLILLLKSCCQAVDINAGILNNNIKIAILNSNQITISLNKGNGERHVIQLGQQLPLIGDPVWFVEHRRFKAKWNNGIQLILSAKQEPGGIRRLKTKWKAPPNILTLQQCIDVGTYNWYGGTEYNYQPWPIQNVAFNKTAYSPGYPYQGGVMAPYFLSSASISYFVDKANPLFVSVGTEVPNAICLTVEFTAPYRNTNGRPLVLDYETTWSDPPDMLNLWYSTSATYFGHPTEIPSMKMSRDPVWSTWVAYKTDINQSLTISFANEIKNRGFPASQIGLDDKWEPCYGEETFDPLKFPDPAAMVAEVKKLGFDVTLWIHPFVNIDCPRFSEGDLAGYFVKINGTDQTGITKWWQGSAAGIIDITNPEAADWWEERLKGILTSTNISSFKIDAGETSWLPQDAYLNTTDESVQPGSYTTLYSEFATKFGNRVESRVGYFAENQNTIYRRVLDRDSVWGLDNGLHSVITTALQMGIVGYPFVLPDYIGGNNYGIYPDRELFIRWVEVTAFMPVMQFSILPWSYDEEVSNISLKMVELHQNISDAIEAAANQSTIDGSPIIRPVWWIEWTDLVAQQINDEFLVGSTYLVAPIITQGSVQRNIYLPKGNWSDMLRGGGEITGPTWLYNYPVALDEIPYFKNTD
ncbi:hypothetical protein CHUAL_008796 [Chamberlinius hualienensis]